MKTERNQKHKKTTVATMPTDCCTVPTICDQLLVLGAALNKEMDITSAKEPPEPKFEMPQWCWNIIKQLGKTILRPITKLRPTVNVDWRNYGRMVTVMERFKAFYEYDLPRILEEEFGDMTAEQWERIEPQFGLDKIRAKMVKLLDRPVADDEPFEKLADEVWCRILGNLERQRQTALYHVAQQSPKVAAHFYKGMGEGYGLLIDERANFCGDRGRTNIHFSLLACMMEVEKIRRTLPPTTRSQFYDELGKVFKLSPKAYDWFNDVCDDIKFPLNNLGRRRRSPAVIL